MPGAGVEPARGFPQGIFVPLQLSLLHAPSHAFVVWTLPLPSRMRPRPRIRQGPSSLYTFALRRLARYCSHPHVLLFHRL